MNNNYKPIKILYQFATAKRKTHNGEKEIIKRKNFLKKFAGNNSQIILNVPSKGPGSIETEYDEAIAIPNVLNSIIDAEKKGFEAAIISCFSDPGLSACREKVKIPIIGSGECSLFLASQLGNKFTILSPLKGNHTNFEKKIAILGLEKKYCSTRSIKTPVLELAKNKEETIKKILKISKEAINIDGADVLVLGCMSMAFHDLTSIIEDKIKVPVINPVKASLLMAESMVKMNLSHSKKTYPTPASKKIY